MNIKVKNNGKDYCTATIELGDMKLFIFTMEDNSLVITDTGRAGNRLAVMPRATNNIEITVINPSENEG